MVAPSCVPTTMCSHHHVFPPVVNSVAHGSTLRLAQGIVGRCSCWLVLPVLIFIQCLIFSLIYISLMSVMKQFCICCYSHTSFLNVFYCWNDSIIHHFLLPSPPSKPPPHKPLLSVFWVYGLFSINWYICIYICVCSNILLSTYNVTCLYVFGANYWVLDNQSVCACLGRTLSFSMP